MASEHARMPIFNLMVSPSLNANAQMNMDATISPECLNAKMRVPPYKIQQVLIVFGMKRTRILVIFCVMLAGQRPQSPTIRLNAMIRPLVAYVNPLYARQIAMSLKQRMILPHAVCKTLPSMATVARLLQSIVMDTMHVRILC